MPASRQGFTLLELLTVITMIGVLAAVVFPALGKGRAHALSIVCASNQRQIGVAWQLYSSDNSEHLVDNSLWVGNYLNRYSDCFDPDLMVDPAKALFAPYISNPAIYLDPASPRTTRTGDTAPLEKPLPRNYALNAWVGSAARHAALQQKHAVAGECRQYLKTPELADPGPSQVFTFTDVHPDSICSPFFGVFMTARGSERISHYPASYHEGRGRVSFADGHSETQRWVDRRTSGSSLDYHFPPYGHNESSEGNKDMRWFQDHATRVIPRQ